jgi:hypothetical protein
MTAFLAFLWGLRFAITSSLHFLGKSAQKCPRAFSTLRNESPQKCPRAFSTLRNKSAQKCPHWGYTMASCHFHEHKKSLSFYQAEIEWQQKDGMRHIKGLPIADIHGLSLKQRTFARAPRTV